MTLKRRIWRCVACGNICTVEKQTHETVRLDAPTCGCLYNPDIGAVWMLYPELDKGDVEIARKRNMVME